MNKCTDKYSSEKRIMYGVQNPVTKYYKCVNVQTFHELFNKNYGFVRIIM